METGIIPDDELVSAKASMSESKYNQEMECSFEAAIIGAYYGKVMSLLERAGRIGDVPVDPAIPVHTAWDLGVSDATAIWFFQVHSGGDVYVVDYYENFGEGLGHYVRILREKKESEQYFYGTHLAPHDIEVRELGTGKSRFDSARMLGLNFTVVPKTTLQDGIEAVRVLLPRCRFDRRRCDNGVEALKQYRAQYDEKQGILGSRPKHDRWSHAADSFRYAACGINLVGDGVNMSPFMARALYEQHAAPRSSV